MVPGMFEDSASVRVLLIHVSIPFGFMAASFFCSLNLIFFSFLYGYTMLFSGSGEMFLDFAAVTD